MTHFWEEATGYEVQVSRGFTGLKPCNYTAAAGQTAHHFRETVIETSRIKQMLFGGFTRCLYPLQKFDSDTERRFAIVLERDSQKWFKPAKGQFQIYYKLGTEQPEYIPDFVAATVGNKPWKYLLIPHDEITESKLLNNFLRFEVKG